MKKREKEKKRKREKEKKRKRYQTLKFAQRGLHFSVRGETYEEDN